MTCPHDFAATLHCPHVNSYTVPHDCNQSYWTFICRVCGCDGYALLDGVKPRTRPAASLTGSRGEA